MAGAAMIDSCGMSREEAGRGFSMISVPLETRISDGEGSRCTATGAGKDDAAQPPAYP
jgi:hypothetical protein